MTEEDPTQEEIDEATKSSRYLTTARGYKSKFDVVDILTNGNIPVFESAADKAICAVELGQLIRKTGFGVNMDNVIKFIKAIDIPHRVMFCAQWTIEQSEQAAEDKQFSVWLNEEEISIAV